ncbi:MAG: pyruvate kinase [Chloroflexi bacterium]|nr:pyruvate kinase [Chloroflexota bacterium]
MRKTKIIATLGPSSDTPDKIEALIHAGMNVARLNFSHGTHDYHAQLVANIREASAKLKKPVAILQDLQGPKIRIGTFANGNDSVVLKDGAEFTVTTRDVEGNEEIVSTTYRGLPWDLNPDDVILLDDGNIELRVKDTSDTDVVTEITHGGVLKQRKGINLPGILVNVPPLTEKDRGDLTFGLSQGVDYIAISFIQRAQDVMDVRRAIHKINPAKDNTPIIAKLEKPAALENLSAILDAADGVMVARGDMGVELSPQQVPSAQKRIIEAANMQGKIVITATQMLESMINSPRPTRAEASDVANAIFDGTDAVMLSAETASGQYPVESVKMMDTIANEAESQEKRWGHFQEMHTSTSVDAVAIARAARELARDRDVKAIAVFTRTGRSASILSKERPTVPVLAFTPEPETYPRLAMLWGVQPYLVPTATSVEEMILDVEQALIHETGLSAGQQVVLIAGLPIGHMGPANIVLLHTVGNPRV